ncbi:hypothetical protein JZ751_013965 [Albula glossodonta]|uniref:Uncharacterized protein n=1 Tax=Albula glossodonta TaxID=121402 RepID=A0A8T2N8Z5_9TELE|nr:hypothetical protein JZ751_013965 [Albula glossodonta]
MVKSKCGRCQTWPELTLIGSFRTIQVTLSSRGGVVRDPRKTPTTARPSGWLTASPKLGYLVFQWTSNGVLRTSVVSTTPVEVKLAQSTESLERGVKLRLARYDINGRLPGSVSDRKALHPLVRSYAHKDMKYELHLVSSEKL